ncbi:GNAT family N-acetyltransferase [Pontibacillus marinus]|uniref:N-acetyltransferase domain-containing protein n=1 Tax=Pontibacillus marinus BH030004 = DSM 16465 TaxID=1385511 RepID=A0A0A5FVN9_9BACI|nr:GNAT family N-acetyltransferase [Pontibacillus marinus]KGX84866.1 hypothetical protein N783_15765 [Pontibacillus marinus BH030004 = DSM 16465]
MLRKLEEKDLSQLLEIIQADEVNNLQFYEYLPYLSNEDERFGFYGKFTNNKLEGALYFSPFNTGFAIQNPLYIYDYFKDILTETSSMYIFGRHDYIQRLGQITGRDIHVYRYGFLPIKRYNNGDIAKRVERASKEDIPELISFYEEKDIMIEIPERIEHIIEKGSIFVRRDGDKIVSAALAHSETDQYALIGAVYTEYDYQGKGYGMHCLKALVQHLHQQEKTPYLFYEEALQHLEGIYQKLSFQHETDIWMLY